jgi:hypothetical protein
MVQPEKEKIWGTLPPSVPLKIRLSVAYDNLRDRLGMINPAAYRFPACPTQRYDMRFLLHQCANVTGTRYLLSIEGWSLTLSPVSFGTTNTLNGAQYAAALEKAISADGWLLIPEDGKLVKVIPKDKLDRYRKAGLVKVRN